MGAPDQGEQLGSRRALVRQHAHAGRLCRRARSREDYPEDQVRRRALSLQPVRRLHRMAGSKLEQFHCARAGGDPGGWHCAATYSDRQGLAQRWSDRRACTKSHGGAVHREGAAWPDRGLGRRGGNQHPWLGPGSRPAATCDQGSGLWPYRHGHG